MALTPKLISVTVRHGSSGSHDEIRRIRYNTQAERRAFLGDNWRKKESMFYMSAGNKRFNERYLNPQPKHVLDSVLRDDGSRDYDPKAYMPEIDGELGKFSPTNTNCQSNVPPTKFTVVSKSQAVTGVTQRSSASISRVLNLL